MKKILLYIVFFTLLPLAGIKTQDIVFSMPFFSPVSLNPAFTGLMNSKSRINLSHRNQLFNLGNESFKTVLAGYDMKFTSWRNDYFAGGLLLSSSQAGALGYRTTSTDLSISYIKRLGGMKYASWYLVGGFEWGMSQYKLELNKAQWGSQHDGRGSFNPNLYAAADHFDRLSFLTNDMGAGLICFFSDNKNKKYFAIGGAFHHLNNFNSSFTSLAEHILSNRYTVHMSGELPLGLHKDIRLIPKVVYNEQAPSRQLIAGFEAKFVREETRTTYMDFRVGSKVRIARHYSHAMKFDALILTSSLRFTQLAIGFSYDMTISPLKTVNNSIGALEISLLYYIKSHEIECPRF